jgi:hypothetical protein
LGQQGEDKVKVGVASNRDGTSTFFSGTELGEGTKLKDDGEELAGTEVLKS